MVFLFYFSGVEFNCCNGNFIPAEEPVLMASHQGFCFGDGLFETMKVNQKGIVLGELHYERLWQGMQLLQYEIPSGFTPSQISEMIFQLCEKNKCSASARVRLSVSRGNGGLYEGDHSFQYIIEARPLEIAPATINENGLVIDVYPHARKSCDAFSHLKSASYLPYVMAALYVKEKQLDDCLLLNAYDRICDATIANVFWIKDGIIYTPPLSEGAVAGVMRKYLLKKFQNTGLRSMEKPCEVEDLENAEEIFLTNSVRGIRWVKQFRGKICMNIQTREINSRLINILFC